MQSKLIGFFPIGAEYQPLSQPFRYHLSNNHLQAAFKQTFKSTTTLRPASIRHKSIKRRKPLKFSVKHPNRRMSRSKNNIDEDEELINKIAFGVKDGQDARRVTQSRFNDTEYETRLLWDSFYSLLRVDKNTGALYFDPILVGDNQEVAYSRLARLIEFYYFEQGVSSKRLRVGATVTDLNRNQSVDLSVFVDLVFGPIHQRKPTTDINQSLNKFFSINSDNLLNLFNKGDEFSTRVRVAENCGKHVPLFNIRKHFEESINLASSRNLVKFSLLKSLRFYLVQDSGNLTGNSVFAMNSTSDGLLYSAVGFDYEQGRSYNAKVLVKQDEEDFANFEYWLDVNVEITNVVDEPVVCDRPIYFLDITENQVKNKKLLTLELKDFESNGASEVVSEAEKRFNAEIVSGNEADLFSMNGLALFTGSTRRRLDRESLDHHQLEVRIKDLGSGRETRCAISVKLSDLNDNRPIVNDVELVVYDKLDTRFAQILKSK